MGYRKLEPPQHDERQHRRVDATGSPGPVIVVNSGATSKLAFPCFYVDDPEADRLVPHDRDHHDHVGWPRADKADRSCQSALAKPGRCGARHPHAYIDPKHLIPIMLEDEGYETFSLVTEKGDCFAGDVGEDPWVMEFEVNLDASGKEPVDVPYTVWADNDAAFTGVIRVMPTVGRK